MVQLVVKSQILAGGRGLGTFKSGLKGGVHIVKTDQVEDIAGNAYSPQFIIKLDIFLFSIYMRLASNVGDNRVGWEWDGVKCYCCLKCWFFSF